MTASRARRPGELAFAAVLIVLSAAAFWQAFGISGFTGPSTPGVFPMLAAAVMTLAAIRIAWRTARLKAVASESASPGPGRFLKEITPLRFVVAVVLILIYLGLIPWLGFVASSAFFLFVSFAYFWRKGVMAPLLLTGVSVGAIYIVFRIVFQVVLPQGTLLRGLL